MYAGSGRDDDGHTCSDEEERSDPINYGMIAAIVGGTFTTTALLFIIVLVATLIHWRRKHRYATLHVIIYHSKTSSNLFAVMI